MAYTLDDFTRDCRSILEKVGAGASPTPEQLSAMAGLLARLLANQDFVAATFKPGDDFSKKPLYHDAKTDFHVMAHVHQGPKEGPPHSHGASWAIYGTAKGVTGMKEWMRVNPESEEAVVLRVRERYDLGEGQTRGYGPHAIHSTIHSATAWVIRVTGTDLDALPRYRFKKTRDRIVETA